MELLAGLDHVAVVTDDLDALCAFYRDVLGASSWASDEAAGIRLEILDLGAGGKVNVFQVDDASIPPAGAMFHRGRVDHFGIRAADAEAFWLLRDRLRAAGVCGDEVTDFGPQIGLMFTDPAGTEVEICLETDPTAAPHEPRPYAVPDRVSVGAATMSETHTRG